MSRTKVKPKWQQETRHSNSIFSLFGIAYLLVWKKSIRNTNLRTFQLHFPVTHDRTTLAWLQLDTAREARTRLQGCRNVYHRKNRKHYYTYSGLKNKQLTPTPTTKAPAPPIIPIIGKVDGSESHAFWKVYSFFLAKNVVEILVDW